MALSKSHLPLLVEPRKRWTDDHWTDCNEVVPNVLSPRDLVFRPDNMNETVAHTNKIKGGRAFNPFSAPLGIQKTKVTLQHYIWIVLLEE